MTSVERTIANLTVLFRGVPIGTTRLVERDRAQPIEPLLPPELRAHLDREPLVSGLCEFAPLPGYSGIAPVVEESIEATIAWSRLEGPTDDPHSVRRLERAEEALSAMCRDLELRDPQGAVVPLTVLDLRRDIIFINVDEVPAATLAALRTYHLRRGDVQPRPNGGL